MMLCIRVFIVLLAESNDARITFSTDLENGRGDSVRRKYGVNRFNAVRASIFESPMIYF